MHLSGAEAGSPSGHAVLSKAGSALGLGCVQPCNCWVRAGREALMKAGFCTHFPGKTGTNCCSGHATHPDGSQGQSNGHCPSG